ncbi:3'(2'),5'-bisphosphate nucleotidase [Synechococcales cyanobacterium C]|uniref:3'(2'),5'-bisphosphate nucleotidase n=1 Tax=Petrachloros mirabilis ULC683 TaxID=2781853 RepID=A0A8K2A2P3_9CYAN|nr:3'(2'),5'-bisphosphate nucleotidase [Petrachloros mirabilis]NCJ08738.1 3'(2'),5'-bisphosphate nucleotidase [Petrachloros mirabilis ULC683]
MRYALEREVAIAAVQQAVLLCEQVRREVVPSAIEKQDRSPVTIADFGAQALICRALADTFPQDPVVGEEDATELRQAPMASMLNQVTHYVQAQVASATPTTVLDWIDHGNGTPSPRFWTLDPIDGTKGFLRGDQYAIALALIENGEVNVGVLGCPALALGDEPPGLMFVAVRGAGTEMISLTSGTTQPLQVVADSLNPRFTEGVEADHSNQALQASIAQAAGITQPSLRIDSQAKYGVIAAGKAALYLRLPTSKYPNYQEKIWDHAAGVIVVEEAGGRVTDMHGQPLDFSQGAKLVNNRGVIVSHGSIHDAVLTALSGVVVQEGA